MTDDRLDFIIRVNLVLRYLQLTYIFDEPTVNSDELRVVIERLEQNWSTAWIMIFYMRTLFLLGDDGDLPFYKSLFE